MSNKSTLSTPKEPNDVMIFEHSRVPKEDFDVVTIDHARASDTPARASVPFVDASSRSSVPRRIAEGTATSADIVHALLHADDESAVIGGLRSMVELLDAAIATDDDGAKAVLVLQAAERATVVLFLARQEYCKVDKQNSIDREAFAEQARIHERRIVALEKRLEAMGHASPKGDA